MAITIKTYDDNYAQRVMLIIIIIVIIIVVVYASWVLYSQASKGLLFEKGLAECTTAPGIPINVSVYAIKNRAIVEWDSVSNTDTYILYVGTGAGFPLPLAQRTITVTGNSIAVLNLLPITYYFKVKAVNSCGSSDVSSEVSVGITDYPEKFKVCKKDEPNFCLLMQTDGAFARISQQCPNNQCDMSYLNLRSIANFEETLCLWDDNPTSVLVEEPLISRPCSGSTKWNVNLDTGRITTDDGGCMGADNIEGTNTYRTKCSLISNPEDARYSWVVQPVTN